MNDKAQALAIAYQIRTKKLKAQGITNKDRVASVVRKHLPIKLHAQAPVEEPTGEVDELEFMDDEDGLPPEETVERSSDDVRKERIAKILANLR